MNYLLFSKELFLTWLTLLSLLCSCTMFANEDREARKKQRTLWIGVEGSTNTHKAEICRILRSHLEKLSLPVILTADPKGTDLSTRINDLVCHLCGQHLTEVNQSPFSPEAEFLLYLAASVEVKQNIIDQNRGKVVICRGKFPEEESM